MKTNILSPTKDVKALLLRNGGIQEMITTLRTLLKSVHIKNNLQNQFSICSTV